MSKNTSILLIVWNVLLSALVAWGLLRKPADPSTAEALPVDPAAEQVVPAPIVPRDPGALKEARIAFFYMDSIQKKYELIAEKDRRFRSEGQRLESSLKNEMAKAQARYEELMKKDHTYSTKAEVAKDEQELQGLMARIQGQQADSEEQLGRLEAALLTEITAELKSYLETYNAEAGYDYIFSVQNGGQVWVGNKGLDISDDLVTGLNAKYRASKGTKK
ncbi:MAG TPA: OmpH family outer membrane protein [Flavobacteriales bacterium]|nr:OmpH family outer membrane protein [Flavobacteriales bacterium]